MSEFTDEERRTDAARRLPYRTIPAAEVFAKLPAHVREAGEARGREALAEYQRREDAKAKRSARPD